MPVTVADIRRELWAPIDRAVSPEQSSSSREQSQAANPLTLWGLINLPFRLCSFTIVLFLREAAFVVVVYTLS